LPAGLDLDWVFSIGVVHHIAEPEPVLRAAYASLKSGGGLLIWVYGREGAERYLRIARPVRLVTTRLPHAVLAALSHAGAWAVSGYLASARALSLPVHSYLESTFAKLSHANRQLVVYDQLRPRYAKYYSRAELRDLLTRCGYSRIELHHRHRYSWTAVGYKA
jgi:SAM-dependent methyltransferase